MHVLCPLIPVVILEHCTDFSTHGCIWQSHPIREQRCQVLYWVTLACTAVRRKVSAVRQDNYWNHWAKDMHIKDRSKVWRHMESLGCKRSTDTNIAWVDDVNCFNLKFPSQEERKGKRKFTVTYERIAKEFQTLPTAFWNDSLLHWYFEKLASNNLCFYNTTTLTNTTPLMPR
jgi:hypothetical protein